MSLKVNSVFAALALVASLFAANGAVEAQGDPAQAGRGTLNAYQARSAFLTNGYQVESISNWSWTNPPVSSFSASDPSSDRVVMVLVYGNSAAADQARTWAAAHDAAGSTAAPHLVSGYGMSSWSGNVALVQSTWSQIARLDRFLADRNDGIYEGPLPPADLLAPALRVDPDFLQALLDTAVNL